MSRRRYRPVKSGATRTLQYQFVDGSGSVLTPDPGTATISIREVGADTNTVDGAAATIVSSTTLEYDFTGPDITTPSVDYIVEWRCEVSGDVTKSGSDGYGDARIVVLKSISS